MIPSGWDPTLADGFLAITDEQALTAARDLARQEGILGGFTTGANVAAAMHLAAQAPDRATIATIAPDTGLRYLSTDLLTSAE
ncbi:MAG: hypothetical protein H0W59_08250 [Chloroflexia bacterium]|nr:hypothetical protein [Chloroflexia bacterium]